MNFDQQVAAAGFPEDVQVTREDRLDGLLFRALQGEPGRRQRGAELLLTPEAVRLYGEGPATAMVLTRLLAEVDAGLPVAQNGLFERIVFVGD
ncbi:hypothetical protein [Deinococcus hohokamensis]|uniref:Uncharacterized protein n=1 Tax=Deinococcus hohokamensis TaxID=309883 RepID=A0ABV9IB02_9DEIO